MGEWIDFRELRQKLNFLEIFENYSVRLKVKGKQATGPCPLPQHGGERKKHCFSANLEKGIFQCFSCEAKGNILDFCCLMDGGDPSRGADLRKTALALSKQSGAAADDQRSRPAKKSPAPHPEKISGDKIVINAPLDFALKNLQTDHPYFAEKELNPGTVAKFGLGFCSRGHFGGRIVIPLHSRQGMLVGYAGRTLDETEPKYLFPGTRKHDNLVHEFRKTELLYNFHRISKPHGDLIVVEGFRSVWWLTQEGFGNVVALMGWFMSDEQEKLIRSLRGTAGTLIILMDGDEAGRKARKSILERFKDSIPIIAPELPPDTQPTDFTSDELESLFDPAAQTSRDKLNRSKSEMICSLINSFPCLDGLRITPQTWDAEAFERQSGKFSSGELAVAQFVLGVWNPNTNWQCGRFDLIEAASRLDPMHRQTIIDWFCDPWWP
jgi:DNA primase